jgi:hypothetical protein
MAINYPPVFINNYLSEKVSEYFSVNADITINLPFFPTSPTDITALTESFPNGNGLFAVYDRMFKMRRTSFPHIKREQLLYYFYKMQDTPEQLIETSQLVQDLLDRGDESAQELNSWMADLHRTQGRQKAEVRNVVTGQQELFDVVTFGSGLSSKQFVLPFFHEIKVYQLEETRDIIDFGTARTYAGNKIIVDYDWHAAPIYAQRLAQIPDEES